MQKEPSITVVPVTIRPDTKMAKEARSTFGLPAEGGYFVRKGQPDASETGK